MVNFKIKDEAAGGGAAEIRADRGQRLFDEPRREHDPHRPVPDTPPPAAETGGIDGRFAEFGLMGSFLRRWADRLPQALALGAGEHVQIPPGNPELIGVLDPFDV